MKNTRTELLPMETQGVTSRRAARTSLAIAEDAFLEAGHDHARALLTRNALSNTGALSAIEGHLQQVTPHAAPRYKAIVDAYVVGTIKRIVRW